jgi:hypothetical protein
MTPAGVVAHQTRGYLSATPSLGGSAWVAHLASAEFSVRSDVSAFAGRRQQASAAMDARTLFIAEVQFFKIGVSQMESISFLGADATITRHGGYVGTGGIKLTGFADVTFSEDYYYYETERLDSDTTTKWGEALREVERLNTLPPAVEYAGTVEEAFGVQDVPAWSDEPTREVQRLQSLAPAVEYGGVVGEVIEVQRNQPVPDYLEKIRWLRSQNDE